MVIHHHPLEFSNTIRDLPNSKTGLPSGSSDGYTFDGKLDYPNTAPGHHCSCFSSFHPIDQHRAASSRILIAPDCILPHHPRLLRFSVDTSTWLKPCESLLRVYHAIDFIFIIFLNLYKINIKIFI